MAIVTTPRHVLPLVDGTQASQEVPHNTSIVDLDILENMAVASVVTLLTAPPGSPADGDTYIVGATATGDWATHDAQIAFYYQGWKFFIPIEGMKAWAKDEDVIYIYNGTAWFPVSVVPKYTTVGLPAHKQGLIVYDTTTNQFKGSTGSAWNVLG
jgi:hypothetical protein